MAQESPEHHLITPLQYLQHLVDDTRLDGLYARPVIPCVDLDPDPHRRLQMGHQMTHDDLIFDQQLQMHLRRQTVDLLHLPEVYRKGNGNLLPPGVGEIAGHGDRGDRDGRHPCLPEPLPDGRTLVGLEVGPESYPRRTGLLRHLPDIPAADRLIHHHRGPDNVHSEWYHWPR